MGVPLLRKTHRNGAAPRQLWLRRGGASPFHVGVPGRGGRQGREKGLFAFRALVPTRRSLPRPALAPRRAARGDTCARAVGRVRATRGRREGGARRCPPGAGGGEIAAFHAPALPEGASRPRSPAHGPPLRRPRASSAPPSAPSSLHAPPLRSPRRPSAARPAVRSALEAGLRRGDRGGGPETRRAGTNAARGNELAALPGSKGPQSWCPLRAGGTVWLRK